jgi:hypothetical protein
MNKKKGCSHCNYTGRKMGDTMILSSPEPLHPCLKLVKKNSLGMPLTKPISYRILSWLPCDECKGK